MLPDFRYVRCALDWAAWVNTPATERGAFYGEQSAESQRINAVDLELRKIQCFSRILFEPCNEMQQLGKTISDKVMDSML